MSILINEDTTFIVQGITGREAVNLTRECLDYGSKIVGGVTPGRKGRDVHGVPVFDTVEQVVEHNGGKVPDGSVVTVPPAFTKDAVFEAIEDGIKLIVIVTERIPRRDVAQMVELADAARRAHHRPQLPRPDRARRGQDGRHRRPGQERRAGLPARLGRRDVAAPGGMTTEISSTLTAAGLGVSTAVSIGGDAIIGSTYAELMPLFEADEQTEAIVIYTEPGGRMEAQLAEWVADNNSRLPIVAFMAGRFMDDEEMKGMSFGHAGTIVEGKEDTATEKIARLEAAGIPVVERIDEIPDAVKAKLGRRRRLMPGIFIDVEVSDERRAATPSWRRSSRRSAPWTSSRPADGGVEIVEEQPRRVRALRALPRRRARRCGARHEALRRHRRSSAASPRVRKRPRG